MKIKEFNSNLLRIVVLALLVSVLLLILFQCAYASDESSERAEQMLTAGDFDATKIIVKYKEEFYDPEKYEKTLGIENIVVEANLVDNSKGFYTSISDEQKANVKNLLIEYLENPEIDLVEPNYIRTGMSWTVGATTATPGDWDASNHWYYENSELPEMWYSQSCPAGSTCGATSDILIAVIDTGLTFESYDDTGSTGFAEQEMGVSGGKDYTAVSPEFDGGNGFNLYENPVEAAFGYNGKDDDCNGWIDDIHGFDIYARESLDFDVETCDEETNTIPIDFSGVNDKYLLKQGHPIDTHGHGTLVTGLIAGTVDDVDIGDEKIVAPAFNATILPIAANQHYTLNYDDAMINVALAEIVNQNIPVDIINLDLGSQAYSAILEARIQQVVNEEGIAIISPSGNDSSSGTLQPVAYPAAYDEVISVGAISEDYLRSDYSNGGTNLDLVAFVGEGTTGGTSVFQDTLSCYPCNSASAFNMTSGTYTSYSGSYGGGTSFAAPQVTAASAVILTNNPNLDPYLLRTALIENTIDVQEVGFDDYTGYGVLNYPQIEDFTAGHIYYTHYGNFDSQNKYTWVIVGNPSTVNTASVNIKIGGVTVGNYEIAPGERILPRYDGVSDGPVEITSNAQIYSTHRSRFGVGLNEYIGIEENDFGTSFYYTHYGNFSSQGKNSWITVGNPNPGLNANIDISIGGNLMGSYIVAPGDRLLAQYDDLSDGPVEVTSTNGVEVYSTLRSRFGEGLNEFKGVTSNDFDTTFNYTHYGNFESQNKYTWLIVGNPSTTTTANVSITIGGNLMGNYVILPGERILPQYEGVSDGPVEIISDIPIYSTHRARFGEGLNEYKGIISSDYDTDYFYTHYGNFTSQQKYTWLIIGNPSTTSSANVDVTIGGNLMNSYIIPPGERVLAQFDDLSDGPVEIVSDIPIYSTHRARFGEGLNEYKGIILP